VRKHLADHDYLLEDPVAAREHGRLA
jgi:hypothetical protein